MAFRSNALARSRSLQTRLRLERLEDRTVPTISVTNVSGILNILDSAGNSTNLTISHSNGMYTLSDTTQTIDASAVGGGSPATSVSFSSGGLTGLNFLLNDGDDSLTINSVGTATAGFTVDGEGGDDSVSVSAVVSTGTSLASVKAESIALTSGAQITTSSGLLSLQAGRSLLVHGGVTLTTTSGDIVLEANKAGTTSGNFAGVGIGASVTTTSGKITIDGIGGDSGGGNLGVSLAGSASITSTGTGTVGAITITGKGGVGGYSKGVEVQGGGAKVESVDASISITGIATADAVESDGLSANGATIQATGTGSVSLKGEAASSDYDYSQGLILVGMTVKTTTGNISLEGNSTLARGMYTGGGTVIQSSAGGSVTITGNRGVQLDGGTSVSTTTADITIEANKAGTSSGNFFGVGIGASVTTTSGKITIDGIGGDSGGGNLGVSLAGSASITSTGTGTVGAITITGKGGVGGYSKGVEVQGGGAKVESVDASISITGNATADAVESDGLSANGATIQATGTGSVSLKGEAASSDYDYSQGLILVGMTVKTTTGNISLEGNSTLARGMYTGGGTVIQSTAGGSVTITGNRVVQLDGGTTVSTTTADITIEANKAGTTTGSFFGIAIGGNVTTTSGKITVDGTGGDTGDGRGVLIYGGAAITSTGTGTVGAIAITGASGAGSDIRSILVYDSNTKIQSIDATITLTGNRSVQIDGGTTVSTTTADITIEANKAGTSSGNFFGVGIGASVTTTSGKITIDGIGGDSGGGNLGVSLAGSASITSTGTGTVGAITITGKGGVGGYSKGVEVQGGGAKVESVDASISITGTATADAVECDGLSAGGATIQATGTGSVSLKGEAASSDYDYSQGLILVGMTVKTTTGNISLKGNSTLARGMYTGGGTVIQSSAGGSVTITGNRGVQLDGGTTVSTTTADITIEGNKAGTTTGSFFGIAIGGNVTTTSGKITVDGTGGDTGDGRGVLVYGGGSITSTGTGTVGAIAITGTSGAGSDIRSILVYDSNTKIQSVDATITLTGNRSVQIDGGTSVSTTTADITIEANKAGTSSGNFFGVGIGASVTTTSGKITIDGTGGDSGGGNLGVYLTGTSSITSMGTGTVGAITITGKGGVGGYSKGVEVQGGGAKVESVDASISITGTATADAVECDGLSAGGATIQATGTGSVSLKGEAASSDYDYSQGLILGGMTVKTTTGNISLEGNSTLARGMYTFGGTVIQSSAGGSVTLTGNRAVQLDGGTSVSTTTADITIEANKAGTTTGSFFGIAIGGNVTTTSGKITVDGTGGDTGDGRGVLVYGGGSITSTGTGTVGAIAITGTSGAGSDLRSIVVYDSNTKIQSIDATITLTGNRSVQIDVGTSVSTTTADITFEGNKAGTSTGSFYGVAIGGTVTTTSGKITIDGTGGDSGGDNDGVVLYGGAAITSTGTGTAGALSITGKGGAGDYSDGLRINDSATKIETVDATIELTGTATTSGSNADGIQFNYGPTVQVTGLASITLTGDTIGGPASGGFAGDSFTLQTTVGDITLNTTTANTQSLYSTGYNVTRSTDGGNIKITGNREVFLVNWVISTTTGDITIEGNKSGTATGNFSGISTAYLNITTESGAITLEGNGGDSGYGNFGVILRNNTTISSTGTGTVGDITITGKGGQGVGRNVGVELAANYPDLSVPSQVTSVDANIVISGTGGSGYDNDNVGIQLRDGVTVASSGVGSVSLTGIGGQGNDYNFGLAMQNTDNDPSVTITVGTVTGEIKLTGTAGTGTTSQGIIAANKVDVVSTGGANLTLITDTLLFGEGPTLKSSGNLLIKPMNPSTSIGIGGGAGTLIIDDTALASFANGFASITLGDTTNGTGMVSMDTATFRDPVTIAGGSISSSPGTDLTLAGTDAVVLQGEITPGGAGATDVLEIAGKITLLANTILTFDIGGIVPGTQHDQLAASGSVNIGSNVTLNFSALPGLTLLPGQRIVLVSRTGGSGTFKDLPEGTVLTNFLGSGRNPYITYVGGNGDDVVLQVPNIAPTLEGSSDSTITDKETDTPFSGVTITDPDTPVTVTIRLDAAGKGRLTNLGGFVSLGNGIYRFVGAADAATTAIRALVFVPTENRVAPGLWETTTFTIEVTDDIAPPVTDSSTKVTTSSVNDAPTLVLPPTLSVPRNGSIVFTGVNRLRVTSVDVGSNPVEVTLSVPHGKLSVAPATGLMLSGNNTTTLVLRGNLSVVNAALNRLHYQLRPGASGTVTLNALVRDLDESPSALTVRSPLQIRIVNTPPSTRSGGLPGVFSFDTQVNKKLIVPVAQGLVRGARDSNGDRLQAVLSKAPPMGKLLLNRDGSFLFTPPAGYKGVVKFRIRYSDGLLTSGEVEVTINCIAGLGRRRMGR